MGMCYSLNAINGFKFVVAKLLDAAPLINTERIE